MNPRAREPEMKTKQLVLAVLGASALAAFSQARAEDPAQNGYKAPDAAQQALEQPPAAGIELPLSAEEREIYATRAKARLAEWEERMAELSDELSEETATSGGERNARLGEGWQQLGLAWETFEAAERPEWDEAAVELQTALDEMNQAWEQRNSNPAPSNRPLGAAPEPLEDEYWAIDLATRMNA
jgi:hypothetical protein